MAKWKRYPILTLHQPYNSDLEKVYDERNEALDLLEEALALRASPKEWNPRVRALFDRLRVKEKCLTCGKDIPESGRWFSCEGRCHDCGQKIDQPKQTTRQKVDEDLRQPGFSVDRAVRTLADAIDELRER